MTEKSKPLPQEAHHSWQLCYLLTEKVPSASGISPQGWREGKRKGRRKDAQSHLSFPFPSTLVLGNGKIVNYCCWLAQRQHKIVVVLERGEHAGHSLH